MIRARLKPRRVRHGRRSHLRLRLAVPGRVRVVVARTRRHRHKRVSVRTVVARHRVLVLRTPRRLRRGRYRITIVAFDAAGNRSRAVHRRLRVVRR